MADKPTAKRYTVKRPCKECGAEFEASRLDREYCSDPCRRKRNNRAMSNGAQAYWALVKWRGTRKKGSFADLTALADQFSAIERDVEAARKTRIADDRAAA